MTNRQNLNKTWFSNALDTHRIFLIVLGKYIHGDKLRAVPCTVHWGFIISMWLPMAKIPKDYNLANWYRWPMKTSVNLIYH